MTDDSPPEAVDNTRGDMVDDGVGPSAEDAAAIMATLKPSSVSATTTDQHGVATTTATKPNPSSVDASSSSKEKSQKKRKKYTTSGSSGGSSSFKRMDDSEFVRCMASEFKRRGYTVALQLKPETNDNIVVPNFPPLALVDDGTVPPPAAGTQLEGEPAATVEQLQPPPTKKVKTTSDVDALTIKKKKSQPQPVALPSFSFYPSTVSISEKNVDSWNNMFEQLKSYHDENNGALPLHHTPQQQQTDTSTNNNNNRNYDIGTLCKWTKAQLTLWKRMKKDNKHNLSLDRIAKLHSLNFDRFCSSQFNMALTVGGGVDGEQVGGGGEGMDNDVLDYQLSTGKNAQKWQEKFDELKRYKDLHGE